MSEKTNMSSVTANQQQINTGGSVEPIVLPAISGDEYYLPLKFENVPKYTANSNKRLLLRLKQT